ncbi:hypothetical protein Sliba_34790 [Streptomyces nigrescens]|uniref:Uncharacterized protein n=1 Tax=Streptomyces nigrescens TaxID=1920 RepID=A0A640TLB4_STRNI|nr:hypothetical protein Sliba_34790 [Streptomyces libani subsp. libani]GGV91979.1 hypothetical protein GCM10010500_23490 [Streptomyces libani subsp. libani]
MGRQNDIALDARLFEGLSQRPDANGHLRPGRGRRFIAPYRVDQAVDRYDTSPREDEHRENGALPGTVDPYDPATPGDDQEWPEYRVFDGARYGTVFWHGCVTPRVARPARPVIQPL